MCWPRTHTHLMSVCLQAIEVCKVLGGVGDVLAKKLIVFDALAGAHGFTDTFLKCWKKHTDSKK